VLLCKTREVVIGELKCVVFLLLCVVNLRDNVMSASLCYLFGLRGYVTKCDLRLGFL